MRHNPMTTYTDDNPVNHHVTTDTLGSLAGRLGIEGHPGPSVELSATASRCAVGAVLRRDGADTRPCSPDSVARRLLHLGSTHRRSTLLEESMTGHIVEIPNRITTTKRAEREKAGRSCWMP
ncbi:hypothetical protein EHS25_005651 [Saitozyma podzolica]|uniref:Uncharacterized protein n=1 Tax=Saitozyma podzolica TaxID=1890683 RepID=A0A427XVT1_9TREE|nr:hypothetical protein EHS25_005651 [Saitozyma podzolica]